MLFLLLRFIFERYFQSNKILSVNICLIYSWGQRFTYTDMNCIYGLEYHCNIVLLMTWTIICHLLWKYDYTAYTFSCVCVGGGGVQLLGVPVLIYIELDV